MDYGQASSLLRFVISDWFLLLTASLVDDVEVEVDGDVDVDFFPITVDVVDVVVDNLNRASAFMP